MIIQLISKDSPFIRVLMAGAEFRRDLVQQGLCVPNVADELCGSEEQLAELVNLCFWSSIAVEEGRPVTGSICICSPDEAPLARAFQVPEPVSVQILVALLSASPESPLAVHAGGRGPVIWGVLDAVPISRLRIRLAAAGTVVASSGRKVMAILQGGTVHVPKNPGDWDWMMIVAAALNRAYSLRDRMKLAARFLRVVATMYRHGHGGALVIAPVSTSSWKKDVTFSFSFDGSSARALRDRLLKWEEAEQLYHDLEASQNGATPHEQLALLSQAANAHRELVNVTHHSIGDLSAIDGALVIDEDLTVLGFGANLQAESGQFIVKKVDALSGSTERVSYSKLGGTRHQSAAQFVHENPEALVFVASQDGRLTLMTWVADSGEVAAIQNLEHFIWEYQA
jgi:hypothetical protein